MSKYQNVNVSILMAIYKPNLEWLREQLISLNNQTYKNIKLFVWNDCPKDKCDYNSFYKKYINKFYFVIYKGENNLGSSKAFEKLTESVDDGYIAYCDQDDIWLPQKIEKLIKKVEDKKFDLICSDMKIIDKNGKIIIDSISEIRPRQKLFFKKDVFEILMVRNFITGCTMMVNAEIAKKALPFSDHFIHDWWLGIYVAAYGKIKVVEEPLILYRIHTEQQTGTLKNIETKNQYFDYKILSYKYKIEELKKRIPDKINVLNKYNDWANIRCNYYLHPSFNGFYKMIANLKIDWEVSMFELIIPFLNDRFFAWFINHIKRK